MNERKGVEIDYCPSCRGVWLDRGELDKLLEHANREQVPGIDDDDADYMRRDRRGAPQDELPPKHSENYPKKRESF